MTGEGVDNEERAEEHPRVTILGSERSGVVSDKTFPSRQYDCLHFRIVSQA